MNRPVVELEEGWAILQMGITKVINIIEGVPAETPMDAACKMELYTAAYNMCNQKPPHHYITQLYERYEGVYNGYLQSNVLPSIQEKRDNVSMLQELVKRWESYKDMVRRLSQPFSFLNPNYVAHKNLPMFKDVGFGCFRKTIGAEIKVQVKDAVIFLINQEREGEEVDQTLLKNVLEIFVDIGNENDTENMEYYVNDFETPFLNDAADYYTRKASNWTPEEYAMKAEECLKTEKHRVSHYLHSSTEEKLLKIVQDVLNTAQTIA
ncbi:hypothetical protein MKW92_018788 [Papaver armeniacum]|nr:hypothetical protein MKW92_018788 [Papaver armeniacum]